ncbi:hypothetical protein ACVLV4_001873 [Rathayibacter agropyri]
MSDDELRRSATVQKDRVPRPGSTADLVVTLILLPLGFVLTATLSLMAFVAAMLSSLYGGSSSHPSATTVTFVVAAAVWVPFLLASVVSVVRLARRRSAAWVPVIGAGGTIAVTVIGAAVGRT